MTPVERQDRVLEALDRQIEIARKAMISMSDVGEWRLVRAHRTSMAAVLAGNATVADRLGDEDAEHIATFDPSSMIRQLEGRRNILQRHAPTPCGVCPTDEWACSFCPARHFPCEDWRDASAGLEEN